jgi:hypothetical protein
VCQQERPEQTIAAEALTAEKAKMPAPITAPARDLLSAVIFNPPFMLSNVRLTAQLNLGSSKTGHSQIQIRRPPEAAYPANALSMSIVSNMPDKAHPNV